MLVPQYIQADLVSRKKLGWDIANLSPLIHGFTIALLFVGKIYIMQLQMLCSDAELMYAAEFDTDCTVMAGKKFYES